MGRNKSKRFVQQGKIAVSKHDERIPYHLTYAEAEAKKLASHGDGAGAGIMSNPLFQQARNAVASAKQACNTGENAQTSIDKAKNALSSAYANSNVEEQKQLHAFQDELNRLS